MYTYDYLKKRGIKIYKDGKQILCGDTSKKYPNFKTEIILGKSLVKQKEVYNVSYDFLLQRGMIITSKDIYGKKFYYITFYSTHAENIGKIPQGHEVKYDNMERKVRLEGKFVYPDKQDWFYIDNEDERTVKKLSVMERAERIASQINPMDYVEEEPEKFTIKEPVLGKSLEGELVCLPRMEDAPVLAVIGMRGQGKTLFVNRLKGQMILKDYALVIELNDRKYDTITYVEEWEDHEFCSDELYDIGEFSIPMPMLYLYINNNKIKDHKIYYENEVAYKVSLPFDELMLDTESFEKYDLWKLDKSLGYFEELIKDENTGKRKEDGLLQFKTITEMKDFIMSKAKSKTNAFGFPVNSCRKIMKILQSIWNTQQTDKSCGIASKWDIDIKGKKEFTYPWVVGMIANLSTTIVTVNIVGEPYIPFDYRFFFESISSEKLRNPILKNKLVMIFSDEVHDILKKKEAEEIVNEKIKVTRSIGCGMTFVTQSSSDLVQEIRDNVTHYVIFKKETSDDIINNKLRDYPAILNRLKNLRNRECVITGEVVLIDPVTGRKYSNGTRPIVMKVLPPNARHNPPPKNGKE